MLLNTILYIIKIYIKQQTTFIFILFAVFSTAISIFLAPIDIGAEEVDRLSKDATIYFRSFILNILAIFFAISHLQREEKGNLYLLPLSFGATRLVYFSASIFSHIFIIFLISLNMLIGDFILNKNFINETIASIFSAILLSVSILSLGQKLSILSSLLLTLSIYFLGNGLDELYLYGYKLHINETFQNLYIFLSKIIPNYYIFEEKINLYISFHFIIWWNIYFYIGYIFFSKKPLKVIN